MRARPDALRIPKVEYAREVHDIVARVARIEQAAGIPEGETKLWCNIESPYRVLNAREIAEADPRVVVLALGAEDFTASMHARRTKAGWEIFLCPQRRADGLPRRRQGLRGRRLLRHQ